MFLRLAAMSRLFCIFRFNPVHRKFGFVVRGLKYFLVENNGHCPAAYRIYAGDLPTHSARASETMELS